MKTRRIVLAGGSGFLGEVLARHFLKRNWEVVILTRSVPHRHALRQTETVNPAGATEPAVRWMQWDGEHWGEWTSVLDGAEVLINLAGLSVNCRYHARNRRRLIDSRILPTRVLGEAIGRCQQPPRVWLNASTATIYRHTFGPAWDESGEIGADPAAKDEFSIEIATTWEREFEAASVPRTRKIALRSAMVLGLGDNSVFPMLRRLTRCGLGGRMGCGRQFVSWIHEADFCRAIDWLIERNDVAGVVNVAAPHPVTNADMMALLRELCRRPCGLPATAWMLEVGAFLLRTETELVIKSRRVTSRRLREGGFEFRFPTMRGAAEDLLKQLAA